MTPAVRRADDTTRLPLWRLDLDGYDRSPVLSAQETASIAAIVGQARTWKPTSYPALRRILAPLDDALRRIVDHSRTNRRHARRLLLWEMHDRGTALWAWSADDWQIILDAHAPRCVQPLLVVAYLLGGVCTPHLLAHTMFRHSLACRIFGPEAVDAAIEQALAVLRGWGYTSNYRNKLSSVVCDALLLAGSPHLTDVTADVVAALRHEGLGGLRWRGEAIGALARILASLGVAVGVVPINTQAKPIPASGDDIAEEWLWWSRRWYETSPLGRVTRGACYRHLLKAGRWLAGAHADVTSPAHWTAELAAEYVAVVDRLRIGDWTIDTRRKGHVPGAAIGPRSKDRHLSCMRAFFRDCQEWEWIPRRFAPARCFATPRTIRSQIGPDPRVIEPALWAKIVMAAVHLSADDTPRHRHSRTPAYPVEMVRALAVVWCFTGLRSDEAHRLRVGCARPQRDDVTIPETGALLPKGAACMLDVPVNKTMTAFSKPVHPLVGERIAAWERVRPPQPAARDAKTGEVVEFLFSYRGTHVARVYINKVLIPLLCRCAGVPTRDARGPITSHRARATIASQLYNSKDPMSLFDLKAWLGHRSLESTQHYAAVSPTRLAKAYIDTGYFERNVATVEVLLDKEAVQSGAAAAGEPWEYFDLGHGYCTYSFFEQCQHRMACAKCPFYLPKSSTKAQLLEGKANLTRMVAMIPLTEEERAAVDGGVELFQQLLDRLADVPTPAGPTPRDLAARGRQLPVVPPVSGETDT